MKLSFVLIQNSEIRINYLIIIILLFDHSNTVTLIPQQNISRSAYKALPSSSICSYNCIIIAGTKVLFGVYALHHHAGVWGDDVEVCINS